MIDTVIINAKIVTSRDITHGCIAIDGGRIELVGPRFLMPESREVIDAEDRFVLPGLVDPHVHYGLMCQPNFVENCKRDWKADAVGAAYGGVTTVLPMLQSNDSYRPVIEELIGWGNERSPIDFAFTLIIFTEEHQDDMAAVFDRGVASFKHFFTAFKDGEGYWEGLSDVNEGYLFRSLERIRDLGAPAIAMCHAEDCELYSVLIERERAKGNDGLKGWAEARPPFTEAVRIEMAARLALETNGPLYFVHLSTNESVQTVRKYKDLGARLASEAVIHTLTVSNDQDDEVGIWGKFVPPLRERREIDAVWRGLHTGTIDTIATDHCCYSLEEKTHGLPKHGTIWDIPPGISNVQEHWLPVLWTHGVRTGRISVQDVARLCSENAARLFGLYPRKGAIQAGADADIVIVDDATEHVVDEKFYHGFEPRLSIYMGQSLVGRPALTMLRGKVILKDGLYVGGDGDGQYVPARLGAFAHEALQDHAAE